MIAIPLPFDLQLILYHISIPWWWWYVGINIIKVFIWETLELKIQLKDLKYKSI